MASDARVEQQECAHAAGRCAVAREHV
jgi:hypothetical protein